MATTIYGGFLETNGGILTGPLLLPDGTPAAPSLSFADDTNTGWLRVSSGPLRASLNGVISLDIANTRINLKNSQFLGWSSDATASGAADTRFYRDAAQTIARRNGTNPQLDHLYGTFTDLSNYERLVFKAVSADDFEIIPEAAGSGTLRGLQLVTAAGRLGFYGTTAIAKPAVTGSRAGNAALADLLTELANLGLITDSSSA